MANIDHWHDAPYDPESMRILSLDTSTSCLSIAVCDDNCVLAQNTCECGRAHAELLLATLDRLLKSAGTTLREINLLAVTNGPGSFTGLRIGMAHWKGLALANSLPLMGVPTLDALARQADVHDGHVCPMIDAKMGEVYATCYRFENGVRTRERAETVGRPEAIARTLPRNTVLLGDGAALYADTIIECLPHATLRTEACPLCATTIAAEALDRVRRGFPTDAASATLMYLRQSQPEELHLRNDFSRSAPA